MIGLVSGALLPCNVFEQSHPHPNDVFDASRVPNLPGP